MFESTPSSGNNRAETIRKPADTTYLIDMFREAEGEQDKTMRADLINGAVREAQNFLESGNWVVERSAQNGVSDLLNACPSEHRQKLLEVLEDRLMADAEQHIVASANNGSFLIFRMGNSTINTRANLRRIDMGMSHVIKEGSQWFVIASQCAYDAVLASRDDKVKKQMMLEEVNVSTVAFEPQQRINSIGAFFYALERE